MQLVAAPAVAARTGKLSPRQRNELPTVFFDNFPVASPWRFVSPKNYKFNREVLCEDRVGRGSRGK